MNINRYNINSLLKLTLIFGIILGAVYSVSAENKDNKEQQPLNMPNKQEQLNTTQQQSNKKTTENKTNTNKLNQETSKGQKKQEQLQESTDKSDSSQSRQSGQNEDNKEPFTKKDILIFWAIIDLPIIVILLLLWFLNKNQQQKQFSNLVKSQNEKVIGKLNELDNKLNNLDKTKREVIKEIQENNQKITNSEISLREHLNKYQVSQPLNHQSSSSFDSGNNDLAAERPSDGYSYSAIGGINNIPEFVETYNRDKNSLSGKAIATVAVTQENIEQRRSGNSDIVTLENTSQKKYWIIEEDSNYYLIPHAKINIEENNLATLQKLFNCSNFTCDYNNFQLVEPAKVTRLSSESWQLEEKGELEFS